MSNTFNALAAAAATRRPSEWVILTNNGTTITARNSVTGETFSGTQAELTAKLSSAGLSEMSGVVVNSIAPVDADGMPNGTIYLQVEA